MRGDSAEGDGCNTKAVGGKRGRGANLELAGSWKRAWRCAGGEAGWKFPWLNAAGPQGSGRRDRKGECLRFAE